MPVISGRGAEEFDDGLLRPRAFAVQQTVGVRLCKQIIHEVQARVAADQDFFRLHIQKRSEKPLAGRKTVEAAVIAHVHAVA